MKRTLVLCQVCECHAATSARAWCDGCENEFSEWLQRTPHNCAGVCQTPFSCRIVKQCLAANSANSQAWHTPNEVESNAGNMGRGR